MSKKFKNFEDVMETLSKGIDADVFIIPNPIAKVTPSGEFYGDDKFFAEGNALLVSNEMKTAEALDLVQLWFVSTDANFACDNIARHAITVTCEDGTCISARPLGEYWPIQIFTGYREGDTVNVRVPFYIHSDYIRSDDGPAWMQRGFTFDISMRATLNQKSYRYGSLGRFQTVLARLTGDSTWMDEPPISTMGTEEEPIPGSLVIDSSTEITEDGVSIRGRLFGVNGDWKTDNLKTGMFVHEHGRKTFWRVATTSLPIDVFNGVEEGGHIKVKLPVVRKRGGEEVECRELWCDFRVSQYSCKDRDIGRVLHDLKEGN